MTGLEYMMSVCPTTSKGRDPNREDVVDAFEDGVEEGYKLHWKPTQEMLDALKWAKNEFHPDCPQTMEQLKYLYEELRKL